MEKDLDCIVTIKLTHDGKRCFGPGIARLLELIAHECSIRKAAACMDMAYSKAMRVLTDCERNLGGILVVRQTGGRHGGGAELSPLGKSMLEMYTQLKDDVAQYTNTHFLSMVTGQDAMIRFANSGENTHTGL